MGNIYKEGKIMKKLQDTIERLLMPFANKLGKNLAIKAISQGMMMTIPFTLIGSIFTILANFPYTPFLNWSKEVGLAQILAFPSMVTTDIIALIATFFIAFNYAKLKKVKESGVVAFLSILCFLIVIPLSVMVEDTSVKAIAFSNLGGKGLFIGIFIGLLVPVIYGGITKKGWRIKMPASVPPAVEATFASVVPVCLTLIVFWLIRITFAMTSYGDVNTMIYSLIQQPLMLVMSSAFSSLILTLLNSVMWFFGIHSMAVNTVLSPAMKALDLANLEAFQNGLALPNTITWNFFMMSAKCGGTGCMLGISLFMAFKAKSKRYRTLGKIASPAVLFNINEPLIFGLPVMLNPILLIPFILSPLVGFGLAYGASILGLVENVKGLQIPVETPVFINGFLQGGISFLLLQVVIVLVTGCIWYPFVNILDEQALAEEQAIKEQSEEERLELNI